MQKRRRIAAIILLSGFLIFIGAYAYGYALIIGSGTPSQYCHDALAEDGPDFAGLKSEGTNVNAVHSMLPYGVQCTYSNGEKQATVFRDLGTPGIIAGAIASAVGAALLLSTLHLRAPSATRWSPPPTIDGTTEPTR